MPATVVRTAGRRTGGRRRCALPECRAWRPGHCAGLDASTWCGSGRGRAGDERLLARAADQISPASLRARFLAGYPGSPRRYLRRIASLPRDSWDAQVALCGDRGGAEQVVGWAEFVRLAARAASRDEADFAILVPTGGSVAGWAGRWSVRCCRARRPPGYGCCTPTSTSPTRRPGGCSLRYWGGTG